MINKKYITGITSTFHVLDNFLYFLKNGLLLEDISYIKKISKQGKKPTHIIFKYEDFKKCLLNNVYDKENSFTFNDINDVLDTIDKNYINHHDFALDFHEDIYNVLSVLNEVLSINNNGKKVLWYTNIADKIYVNIDFDNYDNKGRKFYKVIYINNTNTTQLNELVITCYTYYITINKYSNISDVSDILSYCNIDPDSATQVLEISEKEYLRAYSNKETNEAMIKSELLDKINFPKIESSVACSCSKKSCENCECSPSAINKENNATNNTSADDSKSLAYSCDTLEDIFEKEDCNIPNNARIIKMDITLYNKLIGENIKILMVFITEKLTSAECCKLFKDVFNYNYGSVVYYTSYTSTFGKFKNDFDKNSILNYSAALLVKADSFDKTSFTENSIQTKGKEHTSDYTAASNVDDCLYSIHNKNNNGFKTEVGKFHTKMDVIPDTITIPIESKDPRYEIALLGTLIAKRLNMIIGDHDRSICTVKCVKDDSFNEGYKTSIDIIGESDIPDIKMPHLKF